MSELLAEFNFSSHTALNAVHNTVSALVTNCNTVCENICFCVSACGHFCIRHRPVAKIRPKDQRPV